mgnify:CR=1 FL=1
MWVFDVATDGENEVKSEKCKFLFRCILDVWVNIYQCIYSLVYITIIMLVLVYLNTSCMMGYEEYTKKMKKII